MFLRQLNRHLALVCVIRGENFEKQGLIDYNFNCFKDENGDYKTGHENC
uniref:Uncharacterized protein n=1 Tax=Heterorhabditis bacteriophora TaxID=37862 RepID=A0A1I7WU17_HETBA